MLFLSEELRVQAPCGGNFLGWKNTVSYLIRETNASRHE